MSSESPSNVIVLWRDAVKGAEDRCHVNLHEEIESYLVSLLIRFSTKPELANHVAAIEFMRAMQEKDIMRRYSLANVGDQCLLLSGLFPALAEHRHVKVKYFVDIGRSAYATISAKTTDLYGSLASQFVMLMDVLQTVNQNHILLPLEAYELWHDLGSKRAHDVLRGTGIRI